MEIRVQSIKFNADQKLLDFVEKKFSRLEKFYDAVTSVDVALSLLPDHDNKSVKVQVPSWWRRTPRPSKMQS